MISIFNSMGCLLLGFLTRFGSQKELDNHLNLFKFKTKDLSPAPLTFIGMVQNGII